MNNTDVRNPYKDGIQARSELSIILTKLKSIFDSVTQISRKQLYLVEDTHIKTKFYIYISSAPSNFKLDKDITLLMKKCGKLPFYVLFSRDPKTYPVGSSKSYWAKIKAIYKMRGKFNGCIIGINELDTEEIIDSLFECVKIPLDIERVKNTGMDVSIDLILKELGIISSKLDSAKRMLGLIQKN
jgi:hypothetical protein